MLSVDEVREATESLRHLLAAIEAGELPAEPEQVEQLRGAVKALDVLARA